ncbi:indole-3-glycerol phosphate synthase [Thermoplasma volcanium GSS1]|uniref:Indole-3-glycerol phosphate synthase n=1 Tax=Thermoplasma volcanium (strain ATCC 51530 / DSM 4299 / JCM 9571 / NBRC 15438 / GSS1) TaxID=273116 RepID=TRPC_THEVO|nr:indole-3-glycerol phosphate synthase TrpC [Thermoplasma volcanium]Q979V9.1 RecName: Full=Indole-3-glycerol phosphate synthase; Short=IGPS [Thermoplasma volcanium GSS1]BAB60193.1 indole-3-glycerol phosphate synthase [Thermoplasma volcanium GSS1]
MNYDSVYKSNKLRSFPYSRRRGIISLKERIIELNRSGKRGVIAEYKRRSPSGLKVDYSIEDYLSYVMEHRIAGLSILTEPSFFNGSFQDVVVAHRYNIPILVKDFVPDSEFVDYGFNAGGDAVLVILDFLDYESIKRIVERAADLGMDVLEEFHNQDALKRQYIRDNVMIGYNRRDLTNLLMDEKIPDFSGEVRILESGISIDNVKNLDLKFQGYLIGTSILKKDGTLEYLEMEGII